MSPDVQPLRQVRGHGGQRVCVSVFSVFSVCLCCRNRTGAVAAASLHTALVALSSDEPAVKYSGEATPAHLSVTVTRRH